jgi:hypothetical protein
MNRVPGQFLILAGLTGSIVGLLVVNVGLEFLTRCMNSPGSSSDIRPHRHSRVVLGHGFLRRDSCWYVFAYFHSFAAQGNMFDQ